MKIKRQGKLCFNIITFVILSVIYLHVLFSISENISSFKLTNFINLLEHKKFILPWMLLTVVAVWKYKRYSKVFLTIFCGYISYESFTLVYHSFDKLILFFSFIYFVSALYFIIIWSYELDDSCFNPKHELKSFEQYGESPLSASLKFHDKRGAAGPELHGKLSNWDQYSCFLIFNESLKQNMGRYCTLEIDFGGRVFSEKAEVVATYGDIVGVGIKFIVSNEKNQLFNWQQLFETLMNQGLVPDMIL